VIFLQVLLHHNLKPLIVNDKIFIDGVDVLWIYL